MPQEPNSAPPALRLEGEPNLDIQFPPLPRTVAEVSMMLATKQDVPDTPRLVDVVNVDPVIATAVLRRINSAFYGLRRSIGNLRQAVFLLGFEEVCNIVLTSAMMKLKDVLTTNEQLNIFDRLVRASMGAAYYAQELAMFLDLPQQNTAFAAGLLHNVGRLVFLYNVPHEYEALWYSSRTGRPPGLHDEARIFGLDHGVLGGRAGEEWNLPLEIISVIRHYSIPHLAPEEYDKSFARLISVAASASVQICMHADSGTGSWQFAPPPALNALRQEVDVTPGTLVDFVETHYHRALSYIHAMS